jgi:Sigma-70, region 4
MRTWSLRGTRRLTVDPRRRFGRHGGARRLLSADGEIASDLRGAWGGLVSALQRHTVHGELAQLSREDRLILSLAYLSGHTNREIAAMLHVSVSTVRRRLSQALSRLEESLRRAGLWVSALLLGVLAQSVRNTRQPGTVAVVVAGTAAAVTLTFVAVDPSDFLDAAAAPPVQAHPAQSPTMPPALGRPQVLVSSTTSVPHAVAPDSPAGKLVAAARHASRQRTTPASTSGCHLAVGPHGDHAGAPVTAPGKGGCGPHAS